MSNIATINYWRKRRFKTMRKLHYLWLYFDDEGTDGASGEQTTETKETEVVDEKDVVKFTQNDVDKIVAKRMAREKKASEEAARLAKLSAQERAEAERDALQKELDEMKRANAVAEMEREARKILSADGIVVSDDIVSTLVSEDADETSATVKAFASAFKKAVQDEVKKQLSHKNPSTGSSGNVTKEQIMQEQDPIKRQKLIREHMNLFR
jgi:hypothetical protein